jgi:hypothetical protein
MVTNESPKGGWFMLSGVEFGKQSANAVQVELISRINGKLQIWLDDLTTGKLIAAIPVSTTAGDRWRTLRRAVKNASGHHDVFVKFPPGKKEEILIKTIQFSR